MSSSSNSTLSPEPPSPSGFSTLSDLPSPTSTHPTDVRLYEIDASDPGNVRMLAAAAISRGDRIHVEQPLMTFHIGPAELYNPNTFYKPKDPHNGIKALTRYIDKSPRHIRSAIGKLYCPAGRVWADIVQHNAFEDTIFTLQGEKHCVLHVYNNLSRINHSCRPNATVEFNESPDIQAGTLHALTNIPQGEEISISYLPKPKDSLKVQQQRKSELRKSYKFKCNCDSCGLDRDQAREEDRLRTIAYGLYEAASATGDRTDASLATKAGQWTEYIDHLITLSLFDTKLANAYEILADLHYQRASAALRLDDVTQHCDACAAIGNSVNHIDLALLALTEALRVDLRCLGRDNPRISARETKISAVNQRRERHVG